MLRFVASTLKWSVKGKDFVARFGGEEFAVILQNTDITGAYSVAEQIRRAVSAGKIKDMNSQKMLDKVTISLGIAQFNLSDLPNDLLQRADRALTHRFVAIDDHDAVDQCGGRSQETRRRAGIAEEQWF